MNIVYSVKRLVIMSLLLTGAAHTAAFAGELPIVPNVQLIDNRLTWDPLDGATGYNIYGGGRGGYLATVVDEFEFAVTEVGTYSVVGFNDQGDFTPLRGSVRLFFSDGVDTRPLVNLLSENFLYVTRRCSDVGAGDSCTAGCPDSVGSTDPTKIILIHGATGGACTSSDNLSINSSITPNGYTCTVSNFTSTVTAQAVCSVEIIDR